MQNQTKLYLKIGLTLLIILIIAVYSYINTKNYLEGPSIEIKKPLNGATLTDSLVEIVGVAKNISYISLDDKQIFIDEKGNFKEKLLLFPGYNIIKLYGRDRFKRDITKKLELVLDAKEQILETATGTEPIIASSSEKLSTTTLKIKK
ncbi:hypothetical protein IT397_01515 [Candidatus Nomurabacteria bacterium]|nr:hypothetical protein [Candidatus Nomurabacteria bacterium]